ncbi:MAG TPA: VTT domain-containing protein [Gammaproteobacteria bacterium]|nr:VTT domain-containing protein [Gammaproteobacteria bacterium]
MNTLLATLIDLVGAHQHLAYAVVFFMAFFEALALVGTVFPGSPVILAISALVPSGAVAMWPLVLWTTLGAVGGDLVSYWSGRHYRQHILELRPFRRRPQLIARGRLFFRRHGPKSVFMARFVRGPHAVVPLLAGIMRMKLRPFLLMNIASAAVWAPLHVLTGVVVGASLALAGAVAGRLAAFIAVLLGTLWLIVWLVRQGVRRGRPWVERIESALWIWARSHDNWLARQLLSLLDPHQGEFKGLLLLVVLLIAGVALFFAMLHALLTQDPLVRADVAVYHFLQSLRNAWADRVMLWITELGDAWVTLPLTLTVAAWLAWRRAWRTAAYWVGAVLLAALFTLVMQLTVKTPRPEVLYSSTALFSFPSGHAAVNTTLYAFLAFLIGREAGPRWRPTISAVAAVVITLILFARLYLGAHWLSDVLGGLAFAAAWVSLLAIAYLRHSPQSIHPRGLLIVVLSTVTVFGAWHIVRQYPTDVQVYAVRHDTQTLPAAVWWKQGWRGMPARRIDLAGGYKDPLTVQWAGSLEVLRRDLLRHGWHAPVRWSGSSALTWLTPQPAATSLPVLPKLHEGQPPSLVLVHDVPGRSPSDSRVILRMWRSNVELQAGTSIVQPLWLGTVVSQVLKRPFSLLTVSDDQPDMVQPRRLLAAALPDGRVVYRDTQHTGKGWDGGVLLSHDTAVPVEGTLEEQINSGS